MKIPIPNANIDSKQRGGNGSRSYYEEAYRKGTNYDN